MPSSADAGPVRHKASKANKAKQSKLPIIDALKADPKGFVMRYRTGLMLQTRVKQGKPFTNLNRGTLQGTLRLLYAPEESAATTLLSKAHEKARRKIQEQAALEAAGQKFGFEPKVEVAFKQAPPPSTVSETAVEALVAARATEAASLQPIPLATECNVCYSTFNTLTPAESGEETILRCHMTLCGHSSICSDCFAGYLANKVQADDIMPFISCPHPDCKLPLAAIDLLAPLPTPESVAAFEAEYARLDAQRVERNQAAWDAMHAAALQLDAGKVVHTHKNKRARRASISKDSAGGGSASSPKDAKIASPSPASAGNNRKHSSSSSSSNSSSSSDEESEDDGDWSEAPTPTSKDSKTSSIPIPPPVASSSSSSSSSAGASSSSNGGALSASTRSYLLPTDLLLRLLLTHQSKLLARCREWLPCGSFLRQEGMEEGQEVKKAEEGETTPAAAVEEQKQDEKKGDDAPAPSPDSSSTPSSTSTSSSLSSCPFGFLLVPPFYTPYTHKLKLKKCEHCNLLQEVKLKEEADRAKLKSDPEVDRMIAEGTLRPCPICSLLTMKDVGMCNVIQCAGCSIWWNWSSRSTGKSQSELKDRARNEGSLWEAGELAYQQKLQREDPEAFRALLARNGIEYNPNYVRGSG